MHEWLVDMLECPTCRDGARLGLTVNAQEGGEIIAGALVCAACKRSYPITKGVARFVERADDYCANFGFQWQRWTNLQIDRLGHHHLSESRFFAEVPWDREWMKGKIVLDAGCGAGRFADVAASSGAKVVACDLSDAIDACHGVTRVHGDGVQAVQASIFSLPLRPGAFDGVYCLGVIQHTPDPRMAMEALPRVLKPGGLLAYDFYERTRWEKPYIPRWALRRFTPEWPTERNLALAHALTAAFFPVGTLMARLPLISAFIPALPIAVTHSRELSLKQEYLWSLLDTFDMYGPKYEQRQDHRDVAKLLSRIGMQDIIARYGVVTARAPS